ncbi:hypothetical protein F2Q69_00050721 [Brassica cretica]|uniref:CDP-diacylglycerol--inositol 3-phosphatidyltransferase n=1 Tax=Brassica cretica TaxID=69181 RepID=A0A8S9PJZ5_BRACR|nr:hypothetical protein F2Q69_00050721 [Brassica cretica]
MVAVLMVLFPYHGSFLVLDPTQANTQSQEVNRRGDEVGHGEEEATTSKLQDIESRRGTSSIQVMTKTEECGRELRLGGVAACYRRRKKLTATKLNLNHLTSNSYTSPTDPSTKLLDGAPEKPHTTMVSRLNVRPDPEFPNPTRPQPHQTMQPATIITQFSESTQTPHIFPWSRSSWCFSLTTVSTACLLVILSQVYRPSLVFLSLLALDIASHWLQMYSTFLAGKSSHKDVKDSTSWLFRLYYGNRIFMCYCCVSCEVLYIILLLIAKNQTENLLNVVVSTLTQISPLSFLLALTLFGWSMKQTINIIQMKTAADVCVLYDIEKQQHKP